LGSKAQVVSHKSPMFQHQMGWIRLEYGFGWLPKRIRMIPKPYPSLQVSSWSVIATKTKINKKELPLFLCGRFVWGCQTKSKNALGLALPCQGMYSRGIFKAWNFKPNPTNHHQCWGNAKPLPVDQVDPSAPSEVAVSWLPRPGCFSAHVSSCSARHRIARQGTCISKLWFHVWICPKSVPFFTP